MRLFHRRTSLSLVPPTPEPGVDRTALDSAIASRDSAQQRVIDQSALVDRLLAMTQVADDAARAAADAQARAREARKRWVKNGCLSNALSHHELEGEAVTAVQAARQAQTDASDAIAEYPKAAGDLRFYEGQLQSCEAGIIRESAGIVFEERRTNLLEELARTAEAHVVAMQRANSMIVFLRDAGHRSSADIVYSELVACHIPIRKEARATELVGLYDQYDSAIAPLRERAEQLRADPES